MAGPTRSLLGTVHAEEAEKSGEKRSAKVPGAWDGAAERWSWRARADAWDQAEIDRRRQEHAEALATMHERHAQIAVLFQQRAIERIRGMDPSELSATAVATWFDVAVKVERTARGEPAEIHRQEQTGVGGGPVSIATMPPGADLSRLTDEELAVYERLTAKIYGEDVA